MAANDVVFTVSAQDAGFIRKFLEGRAAVDILNKRVQATGQAAEESGQRLDSMFSGIVRNMGQAMLQFAGVGSAVAGIATAGELVRREFERFQALQVGVFERTAGARAAEAEARQMVSGPSYDLFEPRINGMVRHLPDSETAYRMFTAAMSARTTIDEETAMGAVEAVAKVFGATADQELLTGASSSVLDVLNAMSAEQLAATTPTQVLGSLIGAGQVLRPVTAKATLVNAMRGIVNVIQNTKTPFSEAAAIHAVLGSQGVDPLGLQTSSALVRETEQLQQFGGRFLGMNPKALAAFDQMTLLEKRRFIREARTPEAAQMKAFILGSSARDPATRGLAMGLGYDTPGMTLDGQFQSHVLRGYEDQGIEAKILEVQRRVPGFSDPRSGQIVDELLSGQSVISRTAQAAKGQAATQDLLDVARQRGGLLQTEISATADQVGMWGIDKGIEFLRSDYGQLGAAPDSDLELLRRRRTLYQDRFRQSIGQSILADSTTQGDFEDFSRLNPDDQRKSREMLQELARIQMELNREERESGLATTPAELTELQRILLKVDSTLNNLKVEVEDPAGRPQNALGPRPVPAQQFGPQRP